MIRKQILKLAALAFGIAYFLAFYELAARQLHVTHPSHASHVAVQP